jgi:hypothetical protein
MSRIVFFSELQKDPKVREITSSVVSSGAAGLVGCGVGYAPRVFYLYKLGGGASFRNCAYKQYKNNRVPTLRKIFAGSVIALRNAPFSKISFVAPYVYYKDKNKFYAYTFSALWHAVVTYSSVLGVLAKQSFGADVLVNMWSPELLKRNGLLFLTYIAFSNTVTFESYEKLEPLGSRLSKSFFTSDSEFVIKLMTLAFALPLASALIVPVERRVNQRFIVNMEHSLTRGLSPDSKNFKPVRFPQARSGLTVSLLPKPTPVRRGDCSEVSSPSPTQVRASSPAPETGVSLKGLGGNAFFATMRQSLFLFSLRALWKAVENGITIGGSEYLHKKQSATLESIFS